MGILKEIRGVLVRDNTTDANTLNNDTVTDASQFPDASDGPWPLSDFWQLVTDTDFENSSVNEYTLDWNKLNGGIERVEDQTRTTTLRNLTKFMFSVSFKFSTTDFDDDDNSGIVHFQIHANFGSPLYSIRSQNGRLFHEIIWEDGSPFSANRIQFSEGIITKGEVLKRIIRFERTTELSGRITVWDGATNTLIRCYNPETNAVWVVPTDPPSPISDIYGKFTKGRQPSGGINYPLPMESVGATLLDWWGKSDKVGSAPYYKWGFYRSSYPSSLPVDLQIKILRIGDIAFFGYDVGETDEDAYRALSIDNTLPILAELPSDFTLDPVGATYTLTLIANEGGTVEDLTNTAPYEAGESVTVRATVTPPNSFISWEDGGVQVSTSSTYAFTMPARNLTLTAVFDPPPPVVSGNRFFARFEPIV
jgi:hypothetical protein